MGNLDSLDIFNQIEQERRKGYLDVTGSGGPGNLNEPEVHPHRHTVSPDNDSGITEDEDYSNSNTYSNTTPEPARTPTMFNVNASEFKPSPKRNSGSPAQNISTNEISALTKLDTSPSNNTSSTSPTTSPTVTYHQPGYMILPVRTATQALSTVPNNLVVMRTPQPLYIPNNQKF